MRALYLECNMGATGSMLMAAMTELLENKFGFLQYINSIGFPEVTIKLKPAEKCGVLGSQVKIMSTNREELFVTYLDSAKKVGVFFSRDMSDNLNFSDIINLLTNLNIPKKAKQDATAIYTVLAQAESQTRSVSLEDVWLNDAGTIDDVVHIVSCCLLMDRLQADIIVASPINVGYGSACTPNGFIPVPTPNTAHILRNIPTYGGDVEGELCDSVGAAILRHFVQDFTGMPIMQVEKIGYGMGDEDYNVANCLRAFLGNIAERPSRDNLFHVHCDDSADSYYCDYVTKGISKEM